MAIVISVANQKGGIGKTTTATALLEGLRLKGFKVLGVDLDTQANFTQITNHEKNAHKLLDVVTMASSIEAAIEGDFLASDERTLLVTKSLKLDTLKRLLNRVSGWYDYIIIDTPPKIDLVTLSALAASSEVLITATPDGLAISGVKQLMEAVKTAQKETPSLSCLGLLFVRYSSRTILSQQIKETMEAKAANYGLSVFKTTIRDSVAIREAETLRKPLFDYAKHSNAMKDYKDFINELIKREGDKAPTPHKQHK